MVIRALFTKHVGPAGTRPLEQVLPELEKAQILPREIIAHIRSLKEVANLCAQEGNVSQEGLDLCLIDLVVVLKWLARHVESTQSTSPEFRAVDGLDVKNHRDETIHAIIALD